MSRGRMDKHQPLPRSGEVWTSRQPPASRCSVCEKSPRISFVTEERPTGPGGSMQLWHICIRCSEEMQQLRKSTNSAVVARRLVEAFSTGGVFSPKEFDL